MNADCPTDGGCHHWVSVHGAFATPEIRGLFEEWAKAVEEEIVTFLKEKGSSEPSALWYSIAKDGDSFKLDRFLSPPDRIVIRRRDAMESGRKTANNLDFHSIYRTFHPKIVRYLAHVVGWRDAEDVTQEVFVRVSQALKNFKGESQVSTWVYRIATNSALDKLRSRSFRQTGRESLSGEGIREAEAEIVDKNAWTGEKTPSIETSLIRKEMNECIRGLVEKLPENYRTVVALSELEGFRDDEIAEILKVSIHTAKIRLHRARARLKKDLEGQCNFYRDERNEFACDLKRSGEPPK